jgi:hypothetical protein
LQAHATLRQHGAATLRRGMLSRSSLDLLDYPLLVEMEKNLDLLEEMKRRKLPKGWELDFLGVVGKARGHLATTWRNDAAETGRFWRLMPVVYFGVARRSVGFSSPFFGPRKAHAQGVTYSSPV